MKGLRPRGGLDTEEKHRTGVAALIFALCGWLMVFDPPIWWFGIGAAAVSIFMGSAAMRTGDRREERCGIVAIVLAALSAVFSVLVIRQS